MYLAPAHTPYTHPHGVFQGLFFGWVQLDVPSFSATAPEMYKFAKHSEVLSVEISIEA